MVELAARGALISALLGALRRVPGGAGASNELVAIVGVLLLLLFLEPLVVTLAPDYGRFAPVRGAAHSDHRDPARGGGPGRRGLVAPGVGVLLMLAWIGAAFAAGGALLRRRDLE